MYPSIAENFVAQFKLLPTAHSFDFDTQVREFAHFSNAINSLANFIPHVFISLAKVLVVNLLNP